MMKKSVYIASSLCLVFIFTILLNTFFAVDYIQSIQKKTNLNSYGTLVLPAVLEEELENENDFLKSQINEKSFVFISVFSDTFFLDNIFHLSLLPHLKEITAFCFNPFPLFLKNRIILI